MRDAALREVGCQAHTASQIAASLPPSLPHGYGLRNVLQPRHQVDLLVDALLGGGGLLPRRVQDGRLQGSRARWQASVSAGAASTCWQPRYLVPCKACAGSCRPAVLGQGMPQSSAHLHDAGARPKAVVAQLCQQVPEQEGCNCDGAPRARHQEGSQLGAVGELVPQRLWGRHSGGVGACRPRRVLCNRGAGPPDPEATRCARYCCPATVRVIEQPPAER